jgi:hypothetical protein
MKRILIGGAIAGALLWSGVISAMQDGCRTLETNVRQNSTQVSGGSRTVRLENALCRLELRTRGDIAYSPDFRGIATVSPGGSFTLEEREGGVHRRLTLTWRSGAPESSYQVGGRTQAFDAIAQAWLADRLLLLYRSNGLAAPERAAWLLRTQGLDAVLAEAERVGSSSGRAAYLAAAFAHPAIDGQRIARVLREALPAASTAQGNLLTQVAARRPIEPELAAALLDATRSLSSSTRQREVLLAAAAPDAPRTLVGGALDAAASITSASSRDAVLAHVAQHHTFDDDLLAAYLAAAEGMASSTALRSALEAAVRKPELTQAQLARVLRASTAITSTAARADFLVATAQRELAGDALAAYLQAARSIPGSSQRSRALDALQ